MKVLAVFLVATIVCIQAIDNDVVLQKWRKFQVDFGKTYKSPVEARTRFSIFKTKLEAIEAHNARFEQGEVSYSKGINQFSDWTTEEFMQYVNKGLAHKFQKIGTVYQKSENVVDTSSVDWREKNAVTGVKDQGGCGSCWAFSTTGSLEGQLAIQNGKIVSLSEQNLMDCSWDQGNMGCGGGLMTSAFDYVQENGVESEDDYPYEEYDGSCRADASKVVTKISSYVNIESEDESALQNAIATQGPVSVAIDATYNLQDYSSGILDDDACGTQYLNHGVLAVGYGTENGREFYIIKNSWGSSWGEAGYFRLPRNAENKCGVSTMASYPVL